MVHRAMPHLGHTADTESWDEGQILILSQLLAPHTMQCVHTPLLWGLHGLLLVPEGHWEAVSDVPPPGREEGSAWVVPLCRDLSSHPGLPSWPQVPP